jgi:hypothetical protein
MSSKFGILSGSTWFNELAAERNFSWLSVTRSFSTRVSAMSLTLSATMGFDVCHPRIFRVLFFLEREVDQDIETGEFRVALDDGFCLLPLEGVHLTNGLEEFIQEFDVFFTDSDGRNVLPLRPFFFKLAQTSQHTGLAAFQRSNGSANVNRQTERPFQQY